MLKQISNIMMILTNFRTAFAHRRALAIGADSASVLCGAIGMAMGMTHGIHQSSEYQNGWLWRPTMWGSMGMATGYVCGLYWTRVLTALLVVDIIATCCGKKYKILIKGP